MIDGDFHSHSFGGRLKRNDSKLGGELKYRKFSFGEEVYFTGDVDFTWRVSDCEELVGVTHRG